MIPKYKKFPHGYAFVNFEGQPDGKSIQTDIPAKVTIPLKQGFGNEVAAVVEAGQKVAAGEIIGRDDESVSSPVHSSVNGKVVEIRKIDYLGNEVGAVVVESDRTNSWQKLNGYSSSWENLSAETIGELIYLSGAGSSGRCGIPTAFNSSVIGPEEVENVIIKCVGVDVHNALPDLFLKGEGTANFVNGLKILQKLMPAARFHLALNKSHENLIDRLSILPDQNSVNVAVLPAKYPVDYDEVLTSLVLGMQFPHGYSAANIGVIVVDIQAVLHVYQAVAEGKPVIERTVALCGPGFTERPHAKVRVGSSLDGVIKNKVDTGGEWRFVVNSSLTGESISDLSLPVDRTFSTVSALLEQAEGEFLAFARPGFKRNSYTRTCISMIFKKDSPMFQKSCETNLHGEGRPCLFCGFCEEVCPAGIIPHLLFHYVERDVIDETLLRYKIFNCIECNLCNYVCPSKIGVAQYIKEGKAKLLAEGFELPESGVSLKGVEKYNSVK